MGNSCSDLLPRSEDRFARPDVVPCGNNSCLCMLLPRLFYTSHHTAAPHSSQQRYHALSPDVTGSPLSNRPVGGEIFGGAPEHWLEKIATTGCAAARHKSSYQRSTRSTHSIHTAQTRVHQKSKLTQPLLDPRRAQAPPGSVQKQSRSARSARHLFFRS